jgi:hypothetical protein
MPKEPRREDKVAKAARAPEPADGDSARDFAQQAEGASGGLLRDFWDFLRHYKKWWLVPILVMLLFAGVIAILGGSAIAPFIYTLF